MEKKAPAASEQQTAASEPSPADAASTPPAAAITPLGGDGRRSRDHYRKVAELGVQAAEALDHAHQLGIVHRDIKPANLLLDARGNVWVTDFGLAQMQHNEASLTGTGQMVGTPRYMSPEQALAKRAVIDHRTDVYSLGVTLYELLTLRPAFDSDDRQELLRQIAFEEPSRPRRLERTIPAELEIIILKAMEKRPHDRYATAQELADDLRRWLLDQPIRARRPSWVQVARKWARRHQSAVWAASLLLFVLMILGFINALWWVQQQAEAAEKRIAAATEAGAALQEAKRWQQDERWSEALSAVRRAQAVLRGVGADSDLRQQVEELGKDLEMSQRLEDARVQNTAVKDGGFDTYAYIPACAAAFAWYGLDVEHGDAAAAAECIRSRSIAMQLVAALDTWAILHRLRKDRQWKHLLTVVRAADADELRNRLRDAWERRDGKAVNELLTWVEVEKLEPTTLNLLMFSSYQLEQVSGERMASLLRRAQQRRPADFWVNLELARFLLKAQPPQLEEVIRHFMIVVALRPQSSGAHNNLGAALADKGRGDEAIAEYREAIRLQKDVAEFHFNLGNALRDKGRLDEAIDEYHEAIRLKSDFADAHNNLGTALRKKGRLDEAIAEYREAIRLKKDFSFAHNGLGIALRHKGQLDEAIAAYHEAIRLKEDFAMAHNNLGAALDFKGRVDEAIDSYREAIRLKKDYAEAHYNLGNTLRDKGRLDEAVAEYREAIHFKSDLAEGHCNLGRLLLQQGKFQEAMEELRGGHKIGSTRPGWRYPSAEWVRNAESLMNLDIRLPALLKGQEQPKDARERLALAQLCQLPCKKQYAAASRFFREAFADKPLLADDLNERHRYNAACAAALAGCGQGKDADKLHAKGRARLRGQALEWLRADLKAYRQLMEKSAGKAGPAIAQRMQHWLQDGDFAGVRGDVALAKLPAEEGKEWQKLWQDVEALRQRSAQAIKK